MTTPQRHILFVTGEYPPQTGGVGAYTAELAAALIDLGWQASVLTSASVPAADQFGPIAVYPAVKSWNWRIWRLAPQLAAQIGAGWLHVQYQTAAFGMKIAINLAPPRWRAAGCRVAWTYHDLRAPYLFPKAGMRLRRYAAEYPAARTDLTIVTNEGDRLELAGRMGESGARLARIPIGSNIPALAVSAEERAAYRHKLGYGPDDLVLAYFGFLNQSKGGLTLIRTLERVRHESPNAHLLMIGERMGTKVAVNYAYIQEVEALIAASGLTPYVQWTGRLDEADVSRALTAADVLLMPYEDGASLRRGTLMAGLNHGCAIVTTYPQAPLPELVDGRDLLYTPPGDPAAAAEATLRIAREPTLAARLAAGARAASRQFRWEEIAAQHVALYSE